MSLNPYAQSFMHVIVLALAAFIFNTTEFIPVALLSDIATSFHMSVSAVGWIITIYAWMVAVLSLPLMLLTAKRERKNLLMIIFSVFIFSNVLSACAWNFPILVLSRIGVATAHALFWSISAALAMRLAPPTRRTKALGMLAMGPALAAVLGLPLGRIINQLFSWRMSFLSIAIASAITMVILWRSLPQLPSRRSGDISSLSKLVKRPRLMIIYLLTVSIVIAHFTAYSYIEPFAQGINHLSASMITALLLIFGAAGILGSLLFNRYQVAYPDAFLFIAIIAIICGLLFLAPLAPFHLIWFLLIFIWGVGITAIALAMQYRVLSLAADATDVAVSIFSGIFNVGIGSGALIGGLVIKHFSLGIIGYVGSAFALFAIGLFLWANHHFPREEALKKVTR